MMILRLTRFPGAVPFPQLEPTFLGVGLADIRLNSASMLEDGQARVTLSPDLPYTIRKSSLCRVFEDGCDGEVGSVGRGGSLEDLSRHLHHAVQQLTSFPADLYARLSARLTQVPCGGDDDHLSESSIQKLTQASMAIHPQTPDRRPLQAGPPCPLHPWPALHSCPPLIPRPA